MTFWFNKKINNKKIYCSKSIMINFYKQHWKKIGFRTNGAKRNVVEDTCLDVNIWFFGLHFSYTNWDYSNTRT